MRIGYLIITCLILCNCTPKTGEVTKDTPASPQEVTQVTPQERTPDFSKVKFLVAAASSQNELDRQFLDSLDSKDIGAIRKLVEGGLDLWHSADFQETDSLGNTKVSQYPIAFAVLTSKEPSFISDVLSLAASQKDFSTNDYGSASGESAALRVAVNDRLFDAIDPILKTWPWQLTASWDDGGSLPERPTAYFATKANDREMVEFLLKAGFPGDFEVKRGSRGFPVLLTDETNNAEIRSLLISHGAKDLVIFERKDWMLPLADVANVYSEPFRQDSFLRFFQ